MKKARIRIHELPDGSWRWELRSWYGSIESMGMEYSHEWLAIRDAQRVKRLMAEAEIKRD
jgi:hypothetical protein